MNNYQRINTRKPKGIENKRAFLIGSGIASLAAAEYLMRDGHMKGSQITIFEQDNITGGAMDGIGDPENGFIVRGGREMEEHYECVWDLYGKIPSLEEANRTVLEEFKELNDADPSCSKVRVTYNQGVKDDATSLGLSKKKYKTAHQININKGRGSW